MDARERSGELEEAIRTALDARQAKMETCRPGYIVSFDPETMTCVVQTTIQAKQAAKDGTVSLVAHPLCLDCPCQFPSGGGATLTFPVAPGDECAVIFSSRSLDAWHQSGGIQPPVEARMHDLSDGMVLLGFRSKPRVLSGISTTSTQMRSDDGATVIDLNPTAQTVTVTAPGGITLAADVHITGELTTDGDTIAGGKSLEHHTHSGVQTGSDDTGQPN